MGWYAREQRWKVSIGQRKMFTYTDRMLARKIVDGEKVVEGRGSTRRYCRIKDHELVGCRLFTSKLNEVFRHYI